MTTPAPTAEAPKKDHGRAGRNLPAAITSAAVLLALIAGTLWFWKTAFAFVVAAAVVVGIWELGRGLKAKEIDLPREPLMVGGVVMVLVAYFYGSEALVTATAVTGLVTMLWQLRKGVDGFVRNATAGVFTLVYVPFLASFVSLMLSEDSVNEFEAVDGGVMAIVVFILMTVASDTGGYIAGVLFGKHPMAPVISPKKSWEGFAGSMIGCVAAGWFLLTTLLGGEWWHGVLLGVIVAAMATLGDLVESVIKRDLGVKDMSQVIPGHGGLMDRLDSLLATAAPVWLFLHLLIF